jgi:hypothetical protein
MLRNRKERGRVESALPKAQEPPNGKSGRGRSPTGRVLRLIAITLLVLLGIQLVATAGADTVAAVQKLIRQVIGDQPSGTDRNQTSPKEGGRDRNETSTNEETNQLQVLN